MTYLPDLLPCFKRHFLQFRHYIGQFRNSCDVLISATVTDQRLEIRKFHYVNSAFYKTEYSCETVETCGSGEAGDSGSCCHKLLGIWSQGSYSGEKLGYQARG